MPQLYGQPKGEVFSDEDVLTTQIDEKMRLYAYYECNDEQGNFQSIQLIMSDPNNKNRTKLSQIGALSNGEACTNGFQFPSPDF